MNIIDWVLWGTGVALWGTCAIAGAICVLDWGIDHYLNMWGLRADFYRFVKDRRCKKRILG